MITDSLTPRTTLLALDLGTTTGWALRAPEGQIAHGFVSFKSQRFEGGGMRYLRFRRWLTDMKATLAAPEGPGAVYFEEVRDTSAWMPRTSTAVCWPR